MAVAALPDGWPVMSVAQANAAIAASDSPLKLADGVVGGVSMKIYPAAPPTVRTIFELAEPQFGDRDFLLFEEDRVTYTAFARAVEHFAKALIEQFGVKKGDRVAIIMRNYPQWPVPFFAALSIGAIATPMNSWWTGDELEYGLKDSGARIAVLDPQIHARIKDHLDNLPELETIIVARSTEDATDSRIISMESLIGPASNWMSLEKIGLPNVELGPDDDATIMYTSGTTGRPKGALATHRAIISNMLNSMTCQARMLLRRGEAIPEPDPNDRPGILLAIPFFHATGAFAVLIPSMLRGGKIVSMYKWDAGRALPIIEEEKITVVGGVPAIAWQLLEHPDRDKYDLSSIEAVSYGGAPSAPELVATIKKRFPEASPGNGWGMTETCATATLNIGEDYVNRPDSAGYPPGAVELKIVDPDGKELPAGEVGELWCKGAMNCKASWNKPEATAETFVDGWVVTGDLARFDEEGFLYLVDRAKDMLIRGGENIYCIEVESALYDHPAVMDASVVGIPHKVLGQEVGAVVQLKPGMSASEDELRAHVRSQIAAFKVPVEIQFQDDPLPRNANGKIMKPILRDRFEARE
ncbi:MAG: class I adenylate-forming enzyme family protein [Pseudomonadota bacterium]